jgi:sigma-E factor negative regulatory protein RseA
MSQRSEGERQAAQELSSLMDGELDSSAVANACRMWRDDAQVRREWHAYHLIGDVLRSEDLASKGAHDAAFLAALRERLADEPVVLAPSGDAQSAAGVPARTRRSWIAPAAVAAGFAVVAGTLVVTQMTGGLSSPGARGDAALARAPVGAPTEVVLVDSSASAAELTPMVLNGQLVRDVRLDEYLAAHKRFGGSSLPGGPSGFLRNAVAEVPAR